MFSLKVVDTQSIHVFLQESSPDTEHTEASSLKSLRPTSAMIAKEIAQSTIMHTSAVRKDTHMYVHAHVHVYAHICKDMPTGMPTHSDGLLESKGHFFEHLH